MTERREGGTNRDRISALATGLQEWRDSVDDWRLEVDRRISKRTAIAFFVLIVFMLGSIVVAGAARDLYRRNAERAQEAARIVQEFQAARVQNAQAACVDTNTDRRNLRQLGTDLAGPRLRDAIARRFPLLNCVKYVHDTVTGGRAPQPRPSPEP